jgi:hypothetical protein
MPGSRPVFARMAGQKARRPQLMWIAEILGFPAGQRHEPCLGLGRDRRPFARPGTIIQRRQWTERHGPLHTAPDRLIMHPHGSTNGEKGRVVLICQKHARSLDPARCFSPRSRNRHQLRHVFFPNGQLDHKPRRRHLKSLVQRITEQSYNASPQDRIPLNSAVSWNRSTR